MAITLDLFKTDYDPGIYGIRMYTSESVVKAFNIDVLAINNVNTVASLEELTSIKLKLGSTELNYNITSGESLNGYYHFTVEEQSYDSGLFNTYEGTQIDVNLFPELSNTLFLKSEYQATLNNANTNRTTSFIFDVDRSKNQIIPVNYQSIMSGSATPAQYQELNHTSIGLRNSRYDGSQTSKAEYGTLPSIGLQTFEGVLFGAEVTNDAICSQSLNNNFQTETFGFVVDKLRQDPTSTLLDIPPTQEYPTAITGSNTGNFNATYTGTILNTATTFSISGGGTKYIDEGEVLLLRPSTTSPPDIALEEYIEIDKITSRTISSATLVVKRGLLGVGKTVAPVSTVYFYKVKSDTVYRFDNNKVVRLGRKKLYIPATGQILLISPFGRVLRVEKKCVI